MANARGRRGEGERTSDDERGRERARGADKKGARTREDVRGQEKRGGGRERDTERFNMVPLGIAWSARPLGSDGVRDGDTRARRKKMLPDGAAQSAPVARPSRTCLLLPDEGRRAICKALHKTAVGQGLVSAPRPSCSQTQVATPMIRRAVPP